MINNKMNDVVTSQEIFFCQIFSFKKNLKMFDSLLKSYERAEIDEDLFSALIFDLYDNINYDFNVLNSIEF